MASRDHREGYSKYFGDRLSNLTENSTEDDVRRVYDNWAGQYDKELESAGCVKHKPMVEFFRVLVNEVFQDKGYYEVRIIDAGAGTGLLGVELFKQGFTNVDALDISQGMLNEAKKKNCYRRFICAPLSDQRTPGIETSEYDALVCVGTLVCGHVGPAALEEMIRMVRNGGLICFTVRPDGVDDFRSKMAELESHGAWAMVKEGRLPSYNVEDMPRESSAFAYRVIKN